MDRDYIELIEEISNKIKVDQSLFDSNVISKLIVQSYSSDEGSDSCPSENNLDTKELQKLLPHKLPELNIVDYKRRQDQDLPIKSHGNINWKRFIPKQIIPLFYLGDSKSDAVMTYDQLYSKENKY